MLKKQRNSALILGALMMGGCASAKLPAEKAHRAKVAIYQAERAHADQHAKADCHLNFAREQLAWAERYEAEGKLDYARMLYERAEADADLAKAVATQTEQRAVTLALMRKIHERRRLLEEQTP